MSNRTLVSIELGGTDANNKADARENLDLGANSSVTFSNVTVTGSFVQSNITAANVVIQDPIILLANNQTGAGSQDIGFLGNRGSDTNVAFVWDESEDEFAAVYTANSGGVSTVTVQNYANIRVDVLTATEIRGNISGNLVTLYADSGELPIVAGDEFYVTGDPQSLRTTIIGNTLTVALRDEVIFPGTVTIVGDFTVHGNTSVVHSNNIIVQDTILTLANNNILGFPIDSGIVLIRGNAIANATMIWQAANNRFVFGRTTSNGITANSNIEIVDYANVALGNLFFVTGQGAIFGANSNIVGFQVDGVNVASLNSNFNALRLNTNYFVGTTLFTYHNANFQSGSLYVAYNNSRVGIGTTSPEETLHVLGNVRVTGNLSVSNTIFLNSVGLYVQDGALGLNGGIPSVYYAGQWNSLLGGAANVEATISSPGRAVVFNSINSIAGSDFVIFDESNVKMGVGTTNPTHLDAKLHVYTGTAGAPVISTDADEFAIEGNQNVGLTVLSQSDKIGSIRFTTINGDRGAILYDHLSNNLSINSNASTRVFIANTGNVGIGTTNPTNLLHVAGNVSAGWYTGNGAFLTGIVTTPGGADTQVQFNDGGAFNGTTGLIFNKANSTLTILGNVQAAFVKGDGGILSNIAKGSTTQLQFNDGGVLNGDASLTFNKATQVLTASSNVNLAGFITVNNILGNINTTPPISTAANVRYQFNHNSNTVQYFIMHNSNTGPAAVSVLNISTPTSVMQNYAAPTAGVMGMGSNSPMYFHTNSTFRGCVTADGKWGFGFLAPNTTLEVRGATSIVPVTLTDNTTVLVNFAEGNYLHLTLGGNRTLGTPTNIVPGMSGVFIIRQGAAGSNTLAYNSAYLFPGGTDPTLSTAANAVDLIPWYTPNTTHILMGTIQKAFA